MNENWQQIYDDDLLLCETKPEKKQSTWEVENWYKSKKKSKNIGFFFSITNVKSRRKRKKKEKEEEADTKYYWADERWDRSTDNNTATASNEYPPTLWPSFIFFFG